MQRIDRFQPVRQIVGHLKDVLSKPAIALLSNAMRPSTSERKSPRNETHMRDAATRYITAMKTAGRSTADDNELVRGHQIHAMESNIPKSLLGYLIVVAIGAYFLRSEWGDLFAIWGPFVTAVCLARSYLAWCTARRPVEPTPRSTERFLMGATALVAVSMAIGPTWIVLNSDHYARAFMIIVIVSTMWGGALVQATVLSSTVAFTTAHIPVWIIVLYMSGSPSSDMGLAAIFFVTIGIAIDNTRRYAKYFSQSVGRQIEIDAWDEKARLLRMIDKMPVAVMTIDPNDLTITYVNETSKSLLRSVEHLLPFKPDSLIGMSMDVFHRHPERQRQIMSDPNNLPFHGRMNLGPEVLDVQVSAIVADDGSYLGPMLTWALVTKEVEAENRIRQLAHYDTLTGLPNRVTFREELAKALTTPTNRVGLLYIDLDGFKLVNDTRGHRIGDELLVEVAARLCETCSSPEITVGRLGGDEFVALVPHDNAEDTITLARQIIKALSNPFNLGYDRSLQIGASIGIAFAPANGADADALMARADLALYAAKAAGKGQERVFMQEMETSVQERVRLEAALRDALETRNGLFVFYQPIVDARTGKVTAREALVRWHHQRYGWISPGKFVPIAEQSSLIEQLGDFVLNEACRDAAGRDDGARVAVNISPAQLGNGTIVPAVLSALVGSGLSPDRLEIEVTETVIVGAEATVISDLRRLRDMGVRVALDDFGTGFSSLSHLRLFPFEKIKIDGSFIREAVHQEESAAVVKAVADLGKRLGVTTVAEGVETQAQLDRIREEGCTEVQGYLYGRPAPSDQDAPKIEELEKTRERTIAA